ncbi:MAG TPA: hypothetical protein VGN20_19235 [Mucilaginibacter sp.]|jgi:hypothetical protein
MNNLNNSQSKQNAEEMVGQEIFDIVKTSISKCFLDLNKEPLPKNSSEHLINGITDTIIKFFPSLKTKEIPEIFANGVRGEYGDYYGLSVITFENFIKAHLARVKSKTKPTAEPSPEPTPDEKFDTGKALFVKLIKKYQASGTIDISASAIYEFIKPLGLIASSYKQGVYREAMNKTIAQKEIELINCTDLIRRRLLNGALECLKSNIEKDMITVEQNNEIVRTGKSIILQYWFNDLLIDDTDIDQLIEEKRSYYVETLINK